MKLLFKIAVLLCVFTGTAMSLRAQMAVPPPMPAYQPLSNAQLDQLLGPIALYPDPLIAQILPASTLPTQIVLADRYVSGGGDPNQIDQQPWDASVQALARYPNVLKWMDDNLNWTTELGQAFLNQQQDVMDSIQRLRASASNLGNLQSTPQQQVINDGGDIEIVPANPQVIYVPVYQPDQVYYQSGFGISFGIGFPIGLWLNCDFDWGHHNLIVWGHDHPRPPNWWHEPPRQRDIGHTTVWRPQYSHNYPGVVGLNRGDRGWGVANNRTTAPITGRSIIQPTVPVIGRSVSDSAAARQTPAPAARPEAPATRPSMPVARSAPAPVEHAAPISRPESTGALVGIQSSRDTRTYSSRGQQSMQTVTHSAPVSRPAPATSSGGGGGGHSSGQPKH
ncbi:MAG: DUF3300 domain-containing protein [Verrucomicrobiota bacterium]|jgi:hypothetical protein